LCPLALVFGSVAGAGETGRVISDFLNPHPGKNLKGLSNRYRWVGKILHLDSQHPEKNSYSCSASLIDVLTKEGRSEGCGIVLTAEHCLEIPIPGGNETAAANHVEFNDSIPFDYDGSAQG